MQNGIEDNYIDEASRKESSSSEGKSSKNGSTHESLVGGTIGFLRPKVSSSATNDASDYLSLFRNKPRSAVPSPRFRQGDNGPSLDFARSGDEKEAVLEMLPSDLFADLMLDELSQPRNRNIAYQGETSSGGSSPSEATFAMMSAELTMVRGKAARPVTLSIPSKDFVQPEEPSPQSSVDFSVPRSNDLCAFAMVGKCRYGSMCRNVHGLQCPRCLKHCLHPYDLSKNDEHLDECLGRPDTDIPIDQFQLECGLCFKRIAQREDPRFGLLNCDHSFCLNCIRAWRTQHNTSDLVTKSCPLCHTVTYFIIPSNAWTTDTVEKKKIVDAYKKKLGEIHCKYYNSGDGVCPFGNSCFYAHKNREWGDKPVLRAYVDQNEQVKILREARLCDFMNIKIGKGSAKASKNASKNKDVIGKEKDDNK